jgi:hypothetical protein
MRIPAVGGFAFIGTPNAKAEIFSFEKYPRESEKIGDV